MARDVDWLQARIADKLDFNSSQADSDFSASQTLNLLNEAYDQEVNKGKTAGSKLYFIQTETFTWTGSAVTYDLTSNSDLDDLDIFGFYDITDDANAPREVNPYWRDRDTLVWESRPGPGTDRTIRVLYLAHAEELTLGTQEPLLVPPAHRWLLVWTAAILGREEADEMAPQSWYSRQSDLRLSWYKEIQSRPRNIAAGVQDPEIFSGLEQSRFSRYDFYRF